QSHYASPNHCDCPFFVGQCYKRPHLLHSVCVNKTSAKNKINLTLDPVSSLTPFNLLSSRVY
uniref:Uncharacterized protein n=1 Tax=Scophthalmus maximus TaxID=52904 RepID=A0A8D3BQ68_SCOMX